MKQLEQAQDLVACGRDVEVRYQNRLASAKIRDYLVEQLPQQDAASSAHRGAPQELSLTPVLRRRAMPFWRSNWFLAEPGPRFAASPGTPQVRVERGADGSRRSLDQLPGGRHTVDVALMAIGLHPRCRADLPGCLQARECGGSHERGHAEGWLRDIAVNLGRGCGGHSGAYEGGRHFHSRVNLISTRLLSSETLLW